MKKKPLKKKPVLSKSRPKPPPAKKQAPPEKKGGKRRGRPPLSKGHTPVTNNPLSSPKKSGKRDAAGQRMRERALQAQNEARASVRDIAPLPIKTIDWDRRNECKKSFKLFNETYLSPIFKLDWSEDHLKVIACMERVIHEHIKYALGMSRGGGKTALTRAAIIWGTAYGHFRFPFFIGSAGFRAEQTLDAIKLIWYGTKALRTDFPEIGWPIFNLNNRWHLARGQTFNGQTTHIEWSNERIHYPCVLLEEKDAKPYLQHDPESMLWVEDHKMWMPKACGTIIAAAGVDGSIRGEAEIHPITLEQLRPDIVLLDDIQKDQKIDSENACNKLINLVDGAIKNLCGPDASLAAVMPCTPQREDDVSDTFLNRMKKPDWNGDRFPLVLEWPDGISDEEITKDSEAGKLWNDYAEIRNQSLRTFGDIHRATEFYQENREVMDKGFRVSWPMRYSRKHHISAQQFAMESRIEAPATFGPEFQVRGRSISNSTIMVTAAQMARKTVSLQRRHCPVDTSNLVCFIDPQNEINFYFVLATTPDFTGQIVDYGTWPEINTMYFTKGQTEGWGLLTKAFFDQYPEHRDKAWKTEGGKIRAPLDAKVYHGLSKTVEFLMNREYIKEDGFLTRLKPQRIGIDARWGQANDAIKRFCRDTGFREVVYTNGNPMPPTNKQYSEYTKVKNWLFEDQVNPAVKEVKWVYRPDESGQYHLSMDVNYLKSFVMARLASPPGSPGSFSLFEAIPERHEMVANHLCNSEYPEDVSARGITKQMWQARQGKPDNDWFDGIVGCVALASLQGSHLRPEADSLIFQPQRRNRRLSDLWRSKRNATA